MHFATASRLFSYDHLTGVVTWKVGNGRSVLPGDRAGCIDPSNGYRKIGYRGRQMPEHRLAWLLYYGEMPSCPLDHANRVRDDNRISNLRLATVAENNRNKSVQSTNTSGMPGVYWSAGHNKWKVQLTVGGKRHFLGLHATFDNAKAARLSAERTHFGEFRPSNDNVTQSIDVAA